MNRRGFLSLLTRAVAAAPFAAMLPRWYGTAAQWALHAKEGVLRLAVARRLIEVPPSALERIPAQFAGYVQGFQPAKTLGPRWIGHWEAEGGRILAWVDRTGRAWWAKP